MQIGAVSAIIFIPPALLVLAIAGILVVEYKDRLKEFGDRHVEWLRDQFSGRRRNSSSTRARDNVYDGQEAEEEGEEVYDDQETDLDRLLLNEYEDQGTHPREELDREDAAVTAEGSSTATLTPMQRHQELVRQMRARAGFVDDSENGQEGGEEDEDEEDEDGEEGAEAVGAPGVAKFKKIGKKKAEKLQRKEQMRAYREFMEMQREERRQQDELLAIQQQQQQDERMEKRRIQLEKERQLKKAREEKRVKEASAQEKLHQQQLHAKEKVQKDLIQYLETGVKSFSIQELAKKFRNRTAEQLVQDLATLDRSSLSSSSLSSALTSPSVQSTALLSSPTATTTVTAAATRNVIMVPASGSSRSADLMLLFDKVHDRYIVLDGDALNRFSKHVQDNGRVRAKDLSSASGSILSARA